jgi:M6 family metalloprotease-like protein
MKLKILHSKAIALSVLLSLGVLGLSPISQVASASPNKTSFSKVVTGWKAKQTRLTASQKSTIRTFVKKHKSSAASVQCIAFQNPRATNKEKNRLNKRATATCNEIQRQASWVTTSSSLLITDLKRKHGQVRVKLLTGPRDDSSLGTNANQCKITSTGSGWNSVGFPVTSRFGGRENWKPLKTSGTINALVIGIDFPNYPGQSSPADYVAEATKKNSDFFEAMSYGAVKFEYTVLPRYVRMSKNAEAYGLGSWNSGDYGAYYREALSNAAAEFEIGGYDVAYVMATPQTPSSAITSGPAFPWPELTADGIVPLGTATGGRPDPENAFRGMAHETGHLFGWVDLYDVSGTVNPGGSRQSRFGWWDIMSMNWGTFDLEINGWFRFQLGWIKDSEVLCFQQDKLEEVAISVSNLASGQPQRLVVVRTGPQKALVIERRSITQYAPMQNNPGFAGVLVYEVDGAVSATMAPVSIVRKSGFITDEFLSSAALKTGDVASVAGLEISVISESSTESFLTIKRSK